MEGPIDKLKDWLKSQKAKKPLTSTKRPVLTGLSIKSRGGQLYQKVAERELNKQTQSAQEKAKK